MSRFQRRFLILPLSINMAVLAAAGCAPARADEPTSGKITVEVPAVVEATIRHEVGDGRIVSLGTETEKPQNQDQDSDEDQPPQTLYVVKAVIDDAGYTIRVRTDGKLLDKECQQRDAPKETAAAEDLPDVVRATLKKEAPHARITDVSRQDKQTIYQIEVKIAGHSYLVRIDATGKLLSNELDDQDDTSVEHPA